MEENVLRDTESRLKKASAHITRARAVLAVARGMLDNIGASVLGKLVDEADAKMLEASKLANVLAEDDSDRPTIPMAMRGA